ncbi:DUF4138 domain-containing protein [Thalassobellus citreus]|uniref:DUF4138 domain-containing protein n=1 Tax=Thalassobellus citreus TaxID=3367752 RepID=UPI00379AEF34
MKSIVIILLWLCSNDIIAQQFLDTIYANDKKTVALFFPSPIRQSITGTSNFMFSYNRDKEQYLGLLQAVPGTESNLLTITKDGEVYSYILKYRKELKELSYFISKKESIGNEIPQELKTRPMVASICNNRISDFERYSRLLLESKYRTLATKRKKGIRLQWQKMVYKDSEVYLVFEIKNSSGIDFEMDYLKLYRINGNNKRKASYQKIELGTVYKYHMPHTIKDRESSRFVYVLPKFVLGDNEALSLELKEQEGSRKLIAFKYK